MTPNAGTDRPSIVKPASLPPTPGQTSEVWKRSAIVGPLSTDNTPQLIGVTSARCGARNSESTRVVGRNYVGRNDVVDDAYWQHS